MGVSMDRIQMARELFVKLEGKDVQEIEEGQAIRRARIIALMRND